VQLERWRELVSPKVGVITRVAAQPRGAEEPAPPYLYTATLANFDFRQSDGADRVGAGKGATEKDAIASAVGEAIERYCAYHWAPERTFVARKKDLSSAVITPAECVLYSDQQYQAEGWRYVPSREEAEVTWIMGKELPSSAPVALPASLVFLTYPTPRPEDFFAPSSSNGLAAGPTLDTAVLGGLCELIERDALLIAWLNRLPAIEIELGESDEPAATLFRHYARMGIGVSAFALPTDLPATVVLAISLDDEPSRPAQVVGMGCHPNPTIALTKALYELCQGRPAEATRFAKKPPGDRLVRFEDVQTLDDHSAFGSMREHREQFAFLWSTGRRTRIDALQDPSTGSAPDDVGNLSHALARKGHRVAYVDLTLPDVGACGFHVVRVIATGLQPVHFGYGQERLGGRRLFDLPVQLGFATASRTAADLNRCPHPLA
jgi:ribosomal protein S12 methylthiotransferase accessory factor